jgi:hypothetical protein
MIPFDVGLYDDANHPGAQPGEDSFEGSREDVLSSVNQEEKEW